MGQFLGFGNGGDGAGSLSGTDAPNDTTFSGAATATTGTGKTGMTVADGSIALIHQSRGTGVGAWELIQVASYVSETGAFTFITPLDNTYTDSGASQAQLIILKQYTSVTIASTLTAKAWGGDVGGIIAFLCAGKTTISSTLTATGKGFRYGNAGSGGTDAYSGEGTVGAQVQQTARNGSGAGGGGRGPDSGHIEGGHGGGGGGGGNIAGNDASGKNTAIPGQGGLAGGLAVLTTASFGGGGGGGGQEYDGSPGGTNGGSGGGLIFIFSASYEVSGAVVANGNGSSGNDTSAGCGGGGGGGGILIKTKNGILGTGIITATGGIGGTSTGSYGGKGADGGAGSIRIEACTRTGTTTPSASEQVGGQNYCSVSHAIL